MEKTLRAHSQAKTLQALGRHSLSRHRSIDATIGVQAERFMQNRQDQALREKEETLAYQRDAIRSSNSDQVADTVSPEQAPDRARGGIKQSIVALLGRFKN
jgi:hypothetical protein